MGLGYREGSTYNDLIQYGIIAIPAGGLLIFLSPGGGSLVLLFGVAALIIGLVWKGIAPKKTMGEKRVTPSFWLQICTSYETGGKSGVLMFLSSQRDNLQTKGVRSFLRKEVSKHEIYGNPDPQLEEILEAVEEYCDDPKPDAMRWS